MKKVIYLLRASCVHTFCFCQFLQRSISDILNGLKFPHQGFSSGFSDSRDIIQQRMDLFLTSQGTVEFDSKTVCLILDPGDQAEALTACINRNLQIIIV
jgi:hypothetical protein